MKAHFDGMTHALWALLNSPEARSATVYLSPAMRVTAAYFRKPGSGHLGATIAVTYGKPNWAGRLLIAKCKRDGTALPINQPQLRPWAKLRKKRKTK